MLTRRLLSLCLGASLLASGPAHALSCLRQEIGSSFQAAQERPETFHVALGQLSRVGENRPKGPDTGDVNARVGYSFAARFEGYFAGRDTFDVERAVDVTVEVSCVAAWCGGDSLSDHGLYFFRVNDDGGYALEADACPLFFFDDPVEHQLMAVFGLME